MTAPEPPNAPPQSILYLSQHQILELNATDMSTALVDVEKAFSLHEKGDTILPDKVSMGWGKTVLEEKTSGRINAMPSYLGGDYQMAGIKWIGSNPKNIAQDLPRASAIIILNDPETKFPLAIMDGTLISLVRTGAASGIAVKYLSRKESENLVVIGAGLQCTAQIEATLCQRPHLKNIYISDLDMHRAEQLAATLSEQSGKKITPVAEPKRHAQEADILITATGAAQPVIDASWLNPEGCLYINLGGYECAYDTVQRADKRIVDSWSHVKHRNASTIARMANEGLLDDSQVYANIGDIINDKKEGRKNDQEIIYYNGVGLGILDIAIATRVYRSAMSLEAGTILPYWD